MLLRQTRHGLQGDDHRPQQLWSGGSIACSGSFSMVHQRIPSVLTWTASTHTQ
jgi:hypothetical protein